MTSADRLAELSEHGVSVWLDSLSRGRLRGGGLAALVRDRHVVGVTTNPTIFEQALADSSDYASQVQDLGLRGVSSEEATRSIIGYDVRWACDVLRPVFDRTGGVDGRVSIEVDPRVAHNTAKTVAEARASQWLITRLNVMIKMPVADAGPNAITAATAAGISVNVTLVFGLKRYAAVINAYLRGLEQAATTGVDSTTIRSVASLFVSRVDTEIDARLNRMGTDEARALRGKSGIANARLAYEHYEAVITSPRWRQLEARGATRQRPLWASTGVKNPAYPTTMYVTQLVAPDTVNTMPEATLAAVADHARIGTDTIQSSYEEAAAVLETLPRVGVDYEDVMSTLERDGVQKFVDSWNDLLAGLQAALCAGSEHRPRMQSNNHRPNPGPPPDF
jgi:transaldolase